MEYCAGRRRKLRSAGLVAVIFSALVSGAPLAAQDTFALPQEDVPFLELNVDPAVVAQNERFTLTLTVDTPDPNSLVLDEPDFPDGVVVVRGPSIRPFIERVGITGKRVKTRITYTLRADEAGRKIIGAFTVNSAGREASTDPFLFEIGLRNNARLVPHDVRWRAFKDEISEGETVPLILELTNIREIVFPDSIKVSSPRSGMFEEVEGMGDISSEVVGDVVLYTIPIATYLFTATQKGDVAVPSAQVTALDMARKSGSLKLKVKPLPPEVRDSGAVGRFSFTSALDSREHYLGESLELKLRVEGEGNLNYLQLPEPAAEGLIVTEKHEENGFSASESGFQGFREVTFRLMAESAGSYTVKVPPFLWLDPSSGRIGRADETDFAVNILPVANGEDEVLPDDFPFPLLTSEEISRMQPVEAYAQPLLYLAFLPGPAFLIWWIFFSRGGKGKRNRRKAHAVSSLAGLVFIAAAGSADIPWDTLSQADDLYRAEKYAESLEVYRDAAETVGDNAGVQYNLALAAYRAGAYGESVKALRRAIWLKPMNRKLRSTLAWIENSLKLDKQVPLTSRVHPDILFLASILFINLSCFLAVRVLKRRHGMFIILFVLAVFLTLGAGGGFLYTLTRMAGTTGVIGPDAGSLRKIPRAASLEWLSLKPGTAVRIIAESGNFCLVETGYGIQGWLSGENLMRE